jgi:hypothetical protein
MAMITTRIQRVRAILVIARNDGDDRGDVGGDGDDRGDVGGDGNARRDSDVGRGVAFALIERHAGRLQRGLKNDVGFLYLRKCYAPTVFDVLR